MPTTSRDFELRTSRLAKGLAYPIQRCSLEAAIVVGEALSLRHVTFGPSPGSDALLQAIFQGPQRHNPQAGTCSLSIAPVPARAVKEVEPLILLEGIPAFLRWLRKTELASQLHAKDVFRWYATLANGRLSYSTYGPEP